MRTRKDGWTEAKQRLFIEQLADTACVEAAARAVDMSVQSAYALRRAPGGESFAAAWNAAVQQGALKLVDIAFDRAIHGSDEPVFNRDGRRVGRRMRQSEKLLMFLLRAYLPHRYRHAHRDAVLPGETLLAAPAEPLAQALAPARARGAARSAPAGLARPLRHRHRGSRHVRGGAAAMVQPAPARPAAAGAIRCGSVRAPRCRGRNPSGPEHAMMEALMAELNRQEKDDVA